MTAAITQAVVLGARTAVCASTGNTAASLAAYAARAGLQSAILLPRGQITAGKLAQSLDYGAAGLRNRRKFRRLHALDSGAGRRSFDLRGELDQPISHRGTKDGRLRNDGAVHLASAGSRGGARRQHGQQHGARQRLSGTARARIDRPSAETERDSGGRRGARSRDFSQTLEPEADSRRSASAGDDGSGRRIRARWPRRSRSERPFPGRKSLRAVLRSGGKIIAVSEQEIADAKAMIGRDGIGCEPASATTVAGIKKLVAAGHIEPR